MPVTIPLGSGLPISLCVLKPTGPCLEDLFQCLTRLSSCFEDSGYLHSFILKSIHGNVVVWCGVWTTNTGADIQNALSTLPSIEEFQKMLSPFAHTLDASWFDAFCGETKNGIPAAKISRGDVVTLRALVTESQKQDSLAYACLALIKSYFHKVKGISSYTSMKSSDGVKVMGLIVWEELQHAYAWILDPTLEKSMEPYFEELVVNIKYDIMEVVYATGDHDPPSFAARPHHAIHSPDPC